MVSFGKYWSWNSGSDLRPWHVTMFTVFAAASLIFAAWLAWMTNAFLVRAERTQGTVIELVEHTAPGERGTSKLAYRPKIRFEAPGSGAQEMEMGLQTGSPAYAPGDKVTVVYDPANPQNADIEEFWAQWFGPIVAGGIGVIFLGVAFWIRRAVNAQ